MSDRTSKTVTPTEIRLAVEWLAANASGVSLVDWEPRSQTLLTAADQIEAMASVGVRQERDIEKLRARLQLETAALELSCAAPIDQPITIAAARSAVETSRCIHDRVVCEKCAKMAVNQHLAREDAGPVAAPVETLSITHIFDGEEVVTALVDDGPVWIATFGSYSEADEFVKSLQREPGTTVVGRIRRQSPEEPSYTYTNAAPDHPPILPERFNSTSIPEKASDEGCICIRQSESMDIIATIKACPVHCSRENGTAPHE